MKSRGERITKLQNIKKVLRALIVKFDHIIVAIEVSKNLSEMKLEELQASLEAYEIRLSKEIQRS